MINFCLVPYLLHSYLKLIIIPYITAQYHYCLSDTIVFYWLLFCTQYVYVLLHRSVVFELCSQGMRKLDQSGQPIPEFVCDVRGVGRLPTFSLEDYNVVTLNERCRPTWAPNEQFGIRVVSKNWCLVQNRWWGRPYEIGHVATCCIHTEVEGCYCQAFTWCAEAPCSSVTSVTVPPSVLSNATADGDVIASSNVVHIQPPSPAPECDVVSFAEMTTSPPCDKTGGPSYNAQQHGHTRSDATIQDGFQYLNTTERSWIRGSPRWWKV